MNQNQYQYAKDNRTDQQWRKDYEMGQKAQKLIIERLKNYTEVKEFKPERWMVIEKYRPDCVALIKGLWQNLEIKYTDKDLKMVHWKKNQWEKAKELNIKLLQVSGKKFCLISPWDKCFEKELSYCNKPAMVFQPTWNYTFSALFL